MYPGQPAYPGAPMTGAPMGGMPPYPGAPMPGAPMPGAPMGGMPPYPGAPMPGAPMPGMMPGAPMPGAPMPGAPMPGMMPGAPMPGAPMPGAPMPGMMPGAPMPGAMPGAMGGFPPGYPVFSGTLGADMYYKPVWTAKREAKLQKVWYKIAKDGRITHKEIKKLLEKFHYRISDHEAQWFYHTLDRNRDGRIDYPEVRIAMQQFIMTYPRYRNPKKAGMKPWYNRGYNWRSHPGFCTQYGHLWRF